MMFGAPVLRFVARLEYDGLNIRRGHYEMAPHDTVAALTRGDMK
jgi:hypothetical protein